MKKRTILVLFSIITISILFCSGCTTPNTNNNQQPSHNSSEGPTTTVGERYSFMNDQVHITVPPNALQQQVTLTVDPVDNPPVDSSANISKCYSFGPDREQFNEKVAITLPYDTSQYPSDFPFSILSLFYYHNLEWNKLTPCIVDTAQHTVTGSVMHFCMIGVGYDPKDHPQSNHNQNNSSAIITFEVPVQTFHYETNYIPSPTHPDRVDYRYYCGAYIAWDPQPYVRYYTVINHFNGNPKPKQAISQSCDYRDWGKEWCPLLPYGDPDNRTVFLGPPNQTPAPNHLDYVGLYTIGSYLNGNPVIDGSKHGKFVFNIHTYFDPIENLTRGQMVAVEKQMDEFLASYIEGWTYTVEPFT